MILKITRFVVLGTIYFSMVACKPAVNEPLRYEVEVTRTDFGIPHIKAADYGSLGYGEAYASAQDHVCNMALALMSTKGQSAEYLGAGHKSNYVHNDMVMKALNMPDKGRQALNAQPEKVKEWIAGYAAGYNRYLKDSDGEFGSWCDQAPWVRSATAEEFMTQYVASVYTITRMSGVATQPKRS